VSAAESATGYQRTGAARDVLGQEGRRASETFRVRFDESGPHGTIRASVLLRYASELAWLHSERSGFDRAWYRDRGLIWLVRAVDLQILRPIGDGSVLAGATEIVGVRKVLARRRSEFRAPDGELAAVALVDWALTSDLGRPTRVPSIFATAFGVGAASFAPTRARTAPPPGTTTLQLAVRPHELDPMAHVNNAVYLDWVEEAIAAAASRPGAPGSPGGAHAATPAPPAGPSAIPRRYRLEYLAPASAGQLLGVTAWRDGDAGWGCRIADAVSGDALLGARLEV
jgi:acyl-CoA thioesterase FadM